MGKTTATTWLAVPPSHNHNCSWCARCQFTYSHRLWVQLHAGNLAINLLKRNGLQSRTFYLTSTACVRFDATAALWNFVPSSVLFRSSMQRTRVFNFSYAQSVLVSRFTFYSTSTACVRLTQRRHFGTLFPRRFFFRSSMQRTRVFNFSYVQSVLVSLLRLRGSVLGCLERGNSESRRFPSAS